MNNPAYLSVWVYLLIEAEFQQGKSVLFNGKRVYLQAGQLTCGQNQLSLWSGVPRGTVHRILETFKNEQQIEQQTSNKMSLITILNWSKYQDDEQQNEQQTNNKRTTDEQQMNTPQEVKKLRSKEINKTTQTDFSEKLEEQKQQNPKDQRIEQAIADFRSYRESIKKPLTAIAEIALRKSVWNALLKQDWSTEDVLNSFNNSIMNSWQGVFFDKKPISSSLKNEHHTTQTSSQNGSYSSSQRMGKPESRRTHGVGSSSNEWKSIQSSLSKTIKTIPPVGV